MLVGTLVVVANAERLEDLSTQQLRELASGLIVQIASRDRQIAEREQAAPPFSCGPLRRLQELVLHQ